MNRQNLKILNLKKENNILNILYIHGIKVQVISDDNSLSKFIKKSFPYFQSEVDTTFKLDVTLKLNEINCSARYKKRICY